jgi:hypothetical protein
MPLDLDPNLMGYSTPHSRERGFMPGWEPARTKNNCERVVLDAAIDQINRFRSAGLLPTTPRTIMYRLRAAGLVHPKKGVPYSALKKDLLDGTVGDVLNKARRAGIVSFNDIDDGRVMAEIPTMYDDEDDFLNTLRAGIDEFCYDLTVDQPVRQEVWMEAKGSVALLSRICVDERGIRVYSSGGDPSVRAQLLTAQRAVNDWRAHKRPQIIWQIGDFDGGGVTNFHAFRENVIAFAIAHEPGIDINVVRLMLTEDQVIDDAFVEPSGREPVARVGKAKNWPASVTSMAQLEAVDPAVFRAEVIRVLDSHLDTDLLASKIAANEDVVDSIYDRLGMTRTS